MGGSQCRGLSRSREVSAPVPRARAAPSLLLKRSGQRSSLACSWSCPRRGARCLRSRAGAARRQQPEPEAGHTRLSPARAVPPPATASEPGTPQPGKARGRERARGAAFPAAGGALLPGRGGCLSPAPGRALPRPCSPPGCRQRRHGRGRLAASREAAEGRAGAGIGPVSGRKGPGGRRPGLQLPWCRGARRAPAAAVALT